MRRRAARGRMKRELLRTVEEPRLHTNTHKPSTDSSDSNSRVSRRAIRSTALQASSCGAVVRLCCVLLVTDEFHVLVDCSSHLLCLADVVECRIPEALHTWSSTASGRPVNQNQHNNRHTVRGGTERRGEQRRGGLLSAFCSAGGPLSLNGSARLVAQFVAHLQYVATVAVLHVNLLRHSIH